MRGPTLEEIDQRMTAAFFLLRVYTFWWCAWRLVTLRLRPAGFGLVRAALMVAELRSMKSEFLSTGKAWHPVRKLLPLERKIEAEIERVQEDARRRFGARIYACECDACRTLRPEEPASSL